MTKEKSAGPTPEASARPRTNTPIFTPSENSDKRFATLQARLALLGYSCRRLEGGGYVASDGRRFSVVVNRLDSLEYFLGGRS